MLIVSTSVKTRLAWDSGRSFHVALDHLERSDFVSRRELVGTRWNSLARQQGGKAQGKGALSVPGEVGRVARGTARGFGSVEYLPMS